MRHNNYAVTEVISFIFVVFIVSAATTTVLLWAGPAMEEAKTSINLESTFLQLKALSSLVNQVTNQGVGSSQEMSVETENGNFYFDTLSERVVIYYSICDYDPLREAPFDFTILDGFEIRDPNPYSDRFTIDILKSPFSGNLNYVLYKGDRIYNCIKQQPGSPGQYEIGFTETITDETNTKACIRILEGMGAGPPGVPKEYGEIWVFDLGSLNYNVESGPTSKAIVENGGIVKVTNSGGFLADEPRYWTQGLLNGSKEITLRITDIKSREVKSLGTSSKFKARFDVTAEDVQVLEVRTKVFGDIKMKIYGDDSVVSAWYNFYKYEMGFGDLPDNNGIYLEILTAKEKEERIKPNYMFSLVYAGCNIDMEAMI